MAGVWNVLQRTLVLGDTALNLVYAVLKNFSGTRLQ